MKKFILTLSTVFGFIQFCSSQSWSWVNSGGNSDLDAVKNVSIDSSGNSYIIGVFSQTIFAGANQLTSFGSDDFFIAKYNSLGVLEWARSGGGSSADGYSMSSATDSVGNTIVALAAIGNVQFGTYNLTNTLNDITLLKYDATGNLIFARSYGSNSNDVPIGVALDQQGNIFVAGFFANTISFGSISLNSFGLTDSYLAKFDSDGLPIWAKQAGGTSYDAGAGIAIDKYNHVYFTGYFNSNANFDGQSLSSSGGDDIFIASYDSNGNVRWAKSGDGSGAYDIGNKLSCDINGNVYTIGQFEDTIAFGGLTSVSNGMLDVFIVKADSSGTFKWLNTYGGPADDVGYDIDVLENGTMYYSGLFNDACAFGSTTLTSIGGMDMFIASNFSDGSMFWVKQEGGPGDDIARSIEVKNETECYVAGSFSDLVPFNNFNLQSNGLADFFVGKMAAPLSSVFEIGLNESIAIFPNPAASGQQIYFEFKNEQGKQFRLELIDRLGSVIAKADYFGIDVLANFTLPNVSNGIYFVRIIQSDGKIFSSKISIQK